MPRQEQVKRTTKTVTQKESEEMAAKAAADQEAVDNAQSKEADLNDELLDDIDALLEENEVLVNYRQRGGQ